MVLDLDTIAKGLNDNTALIIFAAIGFRVLISCARLFRVAVIRVASLLIINTPVILLDSPSLVVVVVVVVTVFSCLGSSWSTLSSLSSSP